MLDREDIEKTQLRQLRTTGWQPGAKPQSVGGRDPLLGDGSDALADVIQRDLEHRQALQQEARRRVNSRLAEASPAPTRPVADRQQTAPARIPTASPTHPFSGWSHDDIAGLSQAERLDRLRLLSRISPKRPLYPGLGQDINAGLQVPEELTQFERDLRQRFYDAAVRDPIVSNAEAGWAYLSPAERQRAAERVVALQAEVFGFDPVPIEFEGMPRRLGGRYDRRRNVIVLNSTPVEGRHTLFNAAHEAGHVFQRKLREDFRAGRIAPEDPRYALAEALTLADPYYIRPEQNLAKYHDQLNEEHADQYRSGMYERFKQGFIKGRSSK